MWPGRPHSHPGHEQDDERVSLAQALSAVASHLEPKEAVTILTQAMSKTKEFFSLQYLAQGLSEVAARLEPKEGAATLIQALIKTTEPGTLQVLAQGLSAVAARLEPKEGAAHPRSGLDQDDGTGRLPPPGQGLSAVVSRLEPKEASRACGQAVVTFTQAMSKTMEPNALHHLAPGAVGGGVPPGAKRGFPGVWPGCCHFHPGHEQDDGSECLVASARRASRRWRPG